MLVYFQICNTLYFVHTYGQWHQTNSEVISISPTKQCTSCEWLISPEVYRKWVCESIINPADSAHLMVKILHYQPCCLFENYTSQHTVTNLLLSLMICHDGE